MILLDFESRSRADLSTIGGRLYWDDPSTEALCCVLHDLDTGERALWLPGDPCPVDPEDTLVAHNAHGFDRFAVERLWPEHRGKWIDTRQLAAKAGLPGSLDALSGGAKDHVASRYTISLSRPHRKTGALPAVNLARVVRYCESDVDILVRMWPVLEPWIDVDAEAEAVDRVVNDRGIRVDLQLVKRLIEEDERLKEAALATCARECGMTAEALAAVVRSPKQFTDATGLADARKATIAADTGPFARARRALASIARGKLDALLARTGADGVMRDNFKYYGAHTGRWSGAGAQLQNFPRPHREYSDDEVCALADAVLAGGHADRNQIDVLLRACLVPRAGSIFSDIDYSGVESRALGWLAGDETTLEMIASGRCPYRTNAAHIYGTTYDAVPKTDPRRQVGKVVELSAGYGGGVKALENMAANLGIDLASAGVTSQSIVDGWRELHPASVRFWRDVERAFRAAARGTSTTLKAGVRFDCRGRDVVITLPSGRPIVYRDVEIGFDGLSYAGRRGRENTYGGKLVENIDQALCRDLMADALVRCERDGLRPVLHEHDAIECETNDHERHHNIMTTVPEWAEGFPIGAAGHVARRHRK